jgi:hypothetical protein
VLGSGFWVFSQFVSKGLNEFLLEALPFPRYKEQIFSILTTTTLKKAELKDEVSFSPFPPN